MGQQDFIVARTNPEGGEFQPAYHWACAIDDHDGDYRLLVRAWDLESVLPLHREIHAWVAGQEGGRGFPAVFHAALITQNDGHRLEKRTRGVTLDELGDPARLLELFARSFPDAILPAGAVTGERKKTLTLSELGISR